MARWRADRGAGQPASATGAHVTRVDVAALLAWRSDHPARPLPRDAEQWLLDEVERLRAEVELERAAVVAWLRLAAEEGGDPWMAYCADRIESGEHRREE